MVVVAGVAVLGWRHHSPRPGDGLFHAKVLDHLEDADGGFCEFGVGLVVRLLAMVVARGQGLGGVPVRVVVLAGQAVDVLGVASGDVTVN